MRGMTVQTQTEGGGTRWFIGLALGVTVAIALLLVWMDRERLALLRQADVDQMHSEAGALRRLISETLTRQAQLIALLVDDQEPLISSLLRDPLDEEARSRLLGRIQHLFPEAFTFTLTDEAGDALIEDFDGLIGDACRQEIRAFSSNADGVGNWPVSALHPISEAYHIDLMTRWTTQDGRRGIFFVSLAPTAVSELLAASEVGGRRFLLVRADDPALIEVAAEGPRDRLTRPIRLTDREREQWNFSLDVPHTHWRLLVRPNLERLEAEAWAIRRQTATFFVASLVVSLAIMLLAMRTERRRQARFTAQLREREALLSTVFQTMVDGLITIDEQGRLVSMNAAAERLFGYPEHELLGKNIKKLMPEPYRGSHDGYLQHYIGTGESRIIGIGREVVGQRKDGSVFPMALSVGDSRRFEGRIFVGIVQDISKAVEAREQIARQARDLERSNQDLEHFAFVASHDLQEPLRKISSFGQLLEMEYADAVRGDGSDYIRYMVDAARRMGELIDGLLRYSRVSTRGQPFEKVSLPKLMNTILTDLSLQIKEAGAEIEVELKGEVEADPVQLRQLMQNLLANAIKFRRRDAPRSIRVESRDSDINGKSYKEITVCDNGIGIEAQYLEAVFEPFRRLHTRDQYPGTGLGLAICKKIVERHSGELRVESEPGQGSRFIIQWPLTAG